MIMQRTDQTCNVAEMPLEYANLEYLEHFAYVIESPDTLMFKAEASEVKDIKEAVDLCLFVSQQIVRGHCV